MSGYTLHARDRAAERHGLELSYAEFDQVVIDITDSVLGVARRATLLAALPDGCERWLMRVRERAVRIVWNPELARIVTVLSDQGKALDHWKGRQYTRGRPRTERAVKEYW